MRHNPGRRPAEGDDGRPGPDGFRRVAHRTPVGGLHVVHCRRAQSAHRVPDATVHGQLSGTTVFRVLAEPRDRVSFPGQIRHPQDVRATVRQHGPVGLQRAVVRTEPNVVQVYRPETVRPDADRSAVRDVHQHPSRYRGVQDHSIELRSNRRDPFGSCANPSTRIYTDILYIYLYVGPDRGPKGKLQMSRQVALLQFLRGLSFDMPTKLKKISFDSFSN